MSVKRINKELEEFEHPPTGCSGGSVNKPEYI